MDIENMRSGIVWCVVAVLLAFPGPGALAHDNPQGPALGGISPELLGVPAPRGRGRPVKIEMNEYGFGVKSITVKAGETIRFMIANNGRELHEFNFNTPAEHAAHRPMMAAMMRQGMITTEKAISLTMTMPGGQTMSHIEANAVLVEPGKSAEISWKFTRPGILQIACNVPDHTESGMVATLKVLPR